MPACGGATRVSCKSLSSRNRFCRETFHGDGPRKLQIFFRTMRMYEPKFAGRNTLRRKKVFVPHGMYSTHFFLASPSIVERGFISKSKTIKPIFPICMKTSRPHDARCIPKLWCRCSHCSKAVYQPYIILQQNWAVFPPCTYFPYCLPRDLAFVYRTESMY